MNTHLKVVTNTDEPEIQMLKGIVLTADELAILKQMNSKYAHVVVGGKHFIATKVDCTINGSKLSLGPIKGLLDYFTHLSLIAGMNRGKAWLSWLNKAFFDNGISFHPNPKNLPKGSYNLFEGWHCNPVPGDCSFIINHIKNILCNGNEEAANYFIQWLAHMFQYPEIKPTVAIYLKSVEGTGKGSLFRLLQKMLGVHTGQINGAELVTRDFNAVLIAKLLIFADEVNLNEPKVFNKMKGLISEPICQLEKKRIDAEPMANLARFMFASNHEQVIPAGKRERRFLLIEASSQKASDKSYWVTFNSLINKEYAGHFLHYLLNLDLSDFDPYNAPMTQELIQQKVFNFSMVDNFFLEELRRESPFSGRKEILSTTLMNEFLDWIKLGKYLDNKGKEITPSSARSQLSYKLQKLEVTKEEGRSDRKGGVHYYIPDIQELREAFASEHGLTAQDLFTD